MKILKILFLVIFLVLVLAAAGIFLFLKTFDVNKYKPQILTQIKMALGRDVSIDGLTLNLSIQQGISLRVQGLKVADDPQFTKKQDFLTIKDINLGVDILSYLNKKQILVSNMEIRSPKVTIIRRKDGRVNTQTLGVSLAGPAADSHAGSKTSAQSMSSVDSKPVLPALLVNSIQIKDGIFAYQDETISPKISVEIAQVYLNIKNLSLADPFDFSMEGSLWSRAKNIGVTGTAEINTNGPSVQLSNVKITSDLSDLSGDMLMRSLPMLESAGLEKDFEGQLKASIDKIIVSSKGLESLYLKGSLSGGKIKPENLAVAISDINIPFEATEANVKIKDSFFSLGSGKVNVNGDIDDYLKEQKFHFVIKSQNIDLKEMMDQKDLPVRLTGKFNSQFDVEGQDLSHPESLQDSLRGSGTINIDEGKLIGINVLRLVLDKMSMFPDLAEKVEKNLTEKYKESLNEKDTDLKKVILKTFVKDGSLIVDNAQVETNTFNLLGKGSMTFEQDLNLDASISIPKELSQSIAASGEGLGYLQDEAGEIMIPLSIQGRVPNLRFLPDLEYLGKKAFVSGGREQLQKVLDKAFGKDKDGASPENQPSQDPSQPNQPPKTEEKKSPEQQLIEGVLDQIFK